MTSRSDSNAGNGLATKIVDLQIQLAERENEYDEMRECNEFLTNENLVLEESRQECERELVALKAQRKADLDRLMQLESQLAKFEAGSKSNDAIVASQTNHIESMHSKTLARDQYEAQLEQDNQRLNAEVVDLKNSLQILMFKCREGEQSIETLHGQMATLRNEKQTLGRIVADLKVEQNNALDRHNQEMMKMQQQLDEKEDINQKLVARYLRHRSVWEENQQKANFEIKKLDEVIDNVIATIKDNLDKIGNIPAILMLLKQLTNEE